MIDSALHSYKDVRLKHVSDLTICAEKVSAKVAKEDDSEEMPSDQIQGGARVTIKLFWGN